MLLETFLILAALPFVGLTIFFGTKNGYYNSDGSGGYSTMKFAVKGSRGCVVQNSDFALTSNLKILRDNIDLDFCKHSLQHSCNSLHNQHSSWRKTLLHSNPEIINY